MRVIGIVTDVRHPPGLYVRAGFADDGVIADAYQQFAVQVVSLAVSSATVAGFMPQEALARLLYQQLRQLFGKPKPVVRVSQGVVPDRAGNERAIIIPARALAGQYSDYDEPLFYGLFRSKGELRTVMRAEGGNVDLVIVDQATANATFQHFLGGTFGTGIHLPHPKDPAVLIPSRSYASELLREVHAEWVQAFEALGAKRIVIADSTKVRAKAGGAKTVGGVADVGAEMRATYGAEHVEESSYEAGTFDPQRASRGRRWLRDFPEILSIVEGRVHGNQSSWRRTVKVNATFGISADVLAVFKAKVDGGFERTYDFAVDFHPKS